MDLHNNPIKQKTFSPKFTNNVQNNFTVKSNRKSQGIRLPRKFVSSKLSQKKSTGNVAVCIGYIAWLIIFGVVNYYVLCMFGFEIETTMDKLYLAAMLLVSTLTGLWWFLDKLKNSDGYILKYFIAFIFGVIGDLLGLLESLVICLIIFIAVSIGELFFK